MNYTNCLIKIYDIKMPGWILFKHNLTSLKINYKERDKDEVY